MQNEILPLLDRLATEIDTYLAAKRKQSTVDCDMNYSSITGRDGELMIEALAHTIESYQAQHESDCRDAEIHDMILILEALTDDPNSHRNLARARLEMIAAWAPAPMKNLRMKGANR